MTTRFGGLIEENERRNTEEYNRKLTNLESFPYHIQIGADNRCNMRCGFCLAAAYRENGLLHIQDRKMDRNPEEIFLRLVPYMKYWRFLSVTGPGESLLNPRIAEILELVRRNSDCTVTITTNGVLINARLAEILVRERVDEVSISMDSLRKEIYEELRVNGKFEKVIGAIEAINAAKRAAGSELPRLNLTPNFSRKNIEELPEFIRFASSNGIAVIQATPTQVYRKSWVKESLLSFPGLARAAAEEAEVLARERGVVFVNELRMVYLNRGRGLVGLLKKREQQDFPTDPSTCRKPWSSVYIEPDGEVRPCCYLSPVLGNLYDTVFPEVWNSPSAQELRSGMIRKDLPETCRSCYEFNRHDPSIMVNLKIPGISGE